MSNGMYEITTDEIEIVIETDDFAAQRKPSSVIAAAPASTFDIAEILTKAAEAGASDVHLLVGTQPKMRVNGKMTPIMEGRLMPKDTEHLLKQLTHHETDSKMYANLIADGELDFSYSLSHLGRFRVNGYRQRGTLGVVLRLINSKIPTFEDLKLPEILATLAMQKRGLVLITGPTGSGKSTTLATMIDKRNMEEAGNIITIEDPIEYLHSHKRSTVAQREIGADTNSFARALKSALRQDPDVILVGEMRDMETIGTAITAGETGHLVLSTLHTIGAVKTIDRIIDAFPPNQQQQVKVQLASILVGVVSQQLMPTLDGKGRVAALEIMVPDSAIRNLIREGKTHQIQSSLQTGMDKGMITMDKSILKLYHEQRISKETALEYCVDSKAMKESLGVY